MSSLLVALGAPSPAFGYTPGYGSETSLLAIYKSVAREGNKLLITTQKGVLEFIDKQDSEAANVSHRLAGVFLLSDGRMQFVLIHNYYEGHRYSIVDSVSGKEILIEGRPVLSPDKRRYSAASNDLETSNNSNLLTIVDAKSLSVEHTYKDSFGFHAPRVSGPSATYWVSTTKLFVVVDVMTMVNREYELSQEYMWAELENEKWGDLKAAK